MIYKETENSVSVVTRTYPREKYREIKGKHGVYFVYAEAFELCPDRLVVHLSVPSLKIGCQSTHLNSPFKLDTGLILQEMFDTLVTDIRSLPYA